MSQEFIKIWNVTEVSEAGRVLKLESRIMQGLAVTRPIKEAAGGGTGRQGMG